MKKRSKRRRKIVMDEETIKFLEKLADLRKRAGYTQQELSERIGIHECTIQRYERGAGYPQLGILIMLAQELCYDISGSINYKYYYRQIDTDDLKKQMMKAGLTYRALEKRTKFSYGCISKTLSEHKEGSIECLLSIMEELSKERAGNIGEILPEFTSEYLKRRREDEGMTQGELAKLACLHVSTIKRLETGRPQPKIQTWQKICAVLNGEMRQPKLSSYEFEVGKHYRIFTGLSEADYEYQYCGKRGLHYVFRERHGCWTRTYTKAQLVGKTIEEVKRWQII